MYVYVNCPYGYARVVEKSKRKRTREIGRESEREPRTTQTTCQPWIHRPTTASRCLFISVSISTALCVIITVAVGMVIVAMVSLPLVLFLSLILVVVVVVGFLVLDITTFVLLVSASALVLPLVSVG